MKKFSYFGIAAAVIYVLAVIIGAALWPGYSHLADSISSLTMKSAPNLWLMVPLFMTYNVLMILFAVGLYLWDKSRLLRIAAVSLAVCGLSGALMLIFTQDPIGTALTGTGTVHLILAGIASLTTMLSVLLAGLRFGRIAGLSKLKLFSLISVGIIFVSGGMTPLSMNLFPQYFGLLERITIGTFMVWVCVVSYRLLQNKEDDHTY